jgi:hypothetical protein
MVGPIMTWQNKEEGIYNNVIGKESFIKNYSHHSPHILSYLNTIVSSKIYSKKLTIKVYTTLYWYMDIRVVPMT